MKEAMIVPAIAGRPNCKLDCHNYEGLMYDLEACVDEMQKLLDGETTPERVDRWIKLNWPKLYRARKE